MLEYNDALELLQSLRDEAREPTRYPVRFILVKGLDAWRQILYVLKMEVDEVLNLSYLCADSDSFPYLGNIVSLVKNKHGKILLLPLGECFRFSSQFAGLLKELATMQDVGYKRIYVPLLEINNIFEREMSFVSRFEHKILPAVYLLKGSGKVGVQVIPFRLKKDSFKTVSGIKDYLQIWEQGGCEKITLVTRLAEFLNENIGDFEVKIYCNGYEFLKQQVSNFTLIEESWGSDDQWQWLAEEVGERDFDALAGRLLNIKRYDSEQLLSRWNSFDNKQKWLFFIWSKLRVSMGTYLQLVLRDVKDLQCLEEGMVNQVFEESLDYKLLQERKTLLSYLGLVEMSDSFWELFAKLQDPVKKLRSLSGLTLLEKREVVLAVKELLETNRNREEWWPYLEIAFPELSFYLTPYIYDNDFLTEYFQCYVHSRVLDSPLKELLKKARDAVQKQIIWSFSTRESILERFKENSDVFWIDGMGLEWLNLWAGELKKLNDIQMDVIITRTNFPTITDCNKGWQKEKEVDRRLDDIAHKNNYSFPESFVEEIDIVIGNIKKVVGLLKGVNQIIITSDHGLTRFAFSGGKTSPPKGAKIHKWGRYAEFKETPGEGFYNNYSNCITNGNKIMLAVHEKFESGGWSGGEVHGGATPEECLVPVIMLCRKQDIEKIVRPALIVITPEVNLKASGEGKLIIEITQPVQRVRLHVTGRLISAERQSSSRWQVVLKDLKAGKYRGGVEYEGGFFGEVEFKVIKGLMEEDLGL